MERLVSAYCEGLILLKNFMNKKYRISLIVFLIVFFTLTALIVFLWYLSNYSLTTTCYEITTEKLTEPLRIVQLTDLHNSTFGENNELLISRTAAQSPDLILMTGDMVNSDEENMEIALQAAADLAGIAPVYYSYGNHEVDYENNYEVDLKVAIEQTGAHVLDFSYEDIEVNGQKLRLGGLFGYCIPARFLATNEADPEQCAFLEEFQAADVYTILLTHMPYSWIANDAISEWDIDCVFTGHDHGGQIRIPFIGGLYAPDQGFFPGRDCGLYYSKDGEKVMVLSRGLGKSGRVPRFNNIPEIVVVDILPE